MYNNDYNRNNNNRSNKSFSPRNRQFSAPEPIKPLPLPDDYLEKAEELMQELYFKITSTKLRRIYSMVTEIYNEERLSTAQELSQKSISAIALTRIRIAYEGGRDSKVKEFIERVHILEYLKGIGTKRENFINFVHYMEALVAYHKFFGGRD